MNRLGSDCHREGIKTSVFVIRFAYDFLLDD